jgi:hypothetical protein
VPKTFLPSVVSFAAICRFSAPQSSTFDVATGKLQTPSALAVSHLFESTGGESRLRTYGLVTMLSSLAVQNATRVLRLTARPANNIAAKQFHSGQNSSNSNSATTVGSNTTTTTTNDWQTRGIQTTTTTTTTKWRPVQVLDECVHTASPTMSIYTAKFSRLPSQYLFFWHGSDD